MIGYLVQFIAMASFGLSNCFWSKPLKNVPVLQLITVRAGITSSAFLLVILFQSIFHFSLFNNFFIPVNAISLYGVLVSVAICSVSYFGLFFFTRAIKTGSVSLSIPVLCLGTMVSILIGIFFYKEVFSFSKMLSALCFISGLWCMEKFNKQMWRLHFSRAVGFSLLSMLFWSACSFYRVGIKLVGTVTFSFILELTVCSMSLIGFLIENKSGNFSFQKIQKSDLHSILLLALFGFCGVLFSNLAFLYLPISVLGILAIIQPVISMLFAAYLLKEKLLKVQYAGVAIILLGIWLSNS